MVTVLVTALVIDLVIVLIIILVTYSYLHKYMLFLMVICLFIVIYLEIKFNAYAAVHTHCVCDYAVRMHLCSAYATTAIFTSLGSVYSVCKPHPLQDNVLLNSTLSCRGCGLRME